MAQRRFSFICSSAGGVMRSAAVIALVLGFVSIAFGQAITISKSGANGPIDKRYAQIEPTHVTLPDQQIDAKGHQTILRILEAEQGFAMRPFPRGKKGLTLAANGKLSPAGEEYLSQVTEQGLAASRMLDESLAGSDWASVVSTSGGGSGMTHDHAKLLSTILSLKTHLGFMADEHTCPYISYYSADQIINKNNPAEVAVAIADTIVCSHVDGHVAAEAMMTSAAQHSLSVGEEDARTSLEFVRNIVQTMAVLRGQKTLIFVSPGFLSISEPAMNLESQILNSAAAADVTISTLDARGLFNSFLGASQEVPTLAGIVTRQESHADSMRANQSVLAELADGTGGRFFHSNNDLESGLKNLASAPEYLYLLEISLQGIKPNGLYHQLKVKVDRKDLKVQARKGYFAPYVKKQK